LGSQTFAKNQTFLKKLKITHIINATTEVENYFPTTISYLKIAIEDKESTNIEKCFQSTHQFLHEVYELGGVVLVHSVAGISRRFV
jgi:protein-tyrosine phosphatase